MKFDPFTTAWKTLSSEQERHALAVIDAVAKAVGPDVGLMIEIHGRLAAGEAIRFIRKLESYNIHWCEEPVRARKHRSPEGGEGGDQPADIGWREALHDGGLRAGW